MPVQRRHKLAGGEDCRVRTKRRLQHLPDLGVVEHLARLCGEMLQVGETAIDIK